MSDTPSSQWQGTLGWVRFYSWLTLAVVIYGIAVAHVPFLIGTPWSSCKVGGSELGCVLAFHLYEVPLVSFNAFISWYGLRRFAPDTASSFMSLLNFAVTVNTAFFTFETVLLMQGMQRGAPEWETLGLFSVASALGSGALLGMYVHQRLEASLREQASGARAQAPQPAARARADGQGRP